MKNPGKVRARTYGTKSPTVRSGAEERTFWGARLDVLIFRLRSYHVLISYSEEWNGPKFYKTLKFLGQAGMFLSFQARCSSATRSSTSDLTVADRKHCAVCRWGFGWVVNKAQCFRSARRFWCRRFEPGLFQGFSRHLASKHLNLSR